MIVLGDIHGRQFWKTAVKDHENEEIIFLGDYHDPYDYEEISKQESLINFKDILDFKKEHKDNVTLLLGNHDMHYLDQDIEKASRFDYANSIELMHTFRDNANCFSIAKYKKIGNKKILFTHAGITQIWYNHIASLVNLAKDEELANKLNELYLSKNAKFIKTLNDISFIRWGDKQSGSMIWADVAEFKSNKNWLGDLYQIFGHSQQEKNPVITNGYACLDCRRPFIVDNEGIIKELFDKK